MNYKVGSYIVNGADIRCKVKKACLKCKTLMGDKARGSYKCCVKSSCPGWTMPAPQSARGSYIVIREEDGKPVVQQLRAVGIRALKDMIRQKDVIVIKGRVIKDVTQI